jgi:hypothetical protein
MLSQEILRDRLLDYIKSEGVTQKHLSKLTKINEGTLSKFKNNKSELGSIDTKSLDAYLASKNY